MFILKKKKQIMSNKTIFYKKNDPAKTVSITNENDNTPFYQLSDGNMIKKSDFLKYYAIYENKELPLKENKTQKVENSDYVDPDSFFNSSSIVKPDDIQKIKQADPSKGAIDGAQRTEVKHDNQIFEQQKPQISNESIVKQVDPANVPIPNNTKTDTSQYKVYEDEDKAYEDFINKSIPQQSHPQPQQPVISNDPLDEINRLYEDEKFAYGEDEAMKRKESRIKRLNPQQNQVKTSVEQQNNQQYLDPSELMFKSFKRNYDINIELNFKNKISNPDFIKMMLENIDGDIIGYYKKIIINDIKKDFKIIEDEVEKQLKITIFGEEIESSKKITKKPTTKKPTTKKPTKKSIKKSTTKKDTLIDDELVLGKKTVSGKQKYKYIDENGQEVELLPETAKKRGLDPLKN